LTIETCHLEINRLERL